MPTVCGSACGSCPSLDPAGAESELFVNWFKSLFDL